jgi:hypothetical protein
MATMVEEVIVWQVGVFLTRMQQGMVWGWRDKL